MNSNILQELKQISQEQVDSVTPFLKFYLDVIELVGNSPREYELQIKNLNEQHIINVAQPSELYTLIEKAKISLQS